MRSAVRKIIEDIQPFDDLEKSHRGNALKWIDSDANIFRITKPDNPPKHLVSYFVLFDKKQKKILLVDHIDAQKWLPSGGHVEVDEHPKRTVEREIMEELGQKACFLDESPLFITETATVGESGGHTDVSLWFLLEGEAQKKIMHDQEEFMECKWFTIQEILEMDVNKLDPHMYRFIKKCLL